MACGITLSAFAPPALALDADGSVVTAVARALAVAPAAESANRVPPTPGNLQAPPAKPAALMLPELSVGGRVKLDIIVNSGNGSGSSRRRSNLALSPGTIPVSGAGRGEPLNVSARNSRAWLKAIVPTRHGELASYVEVDFFSPGGDGSRSLIDDYSPRLRHAYGQWGEWLGGRTYSTAVDLDAYPEINDDGGPLGVLLVRHALVRWRRAWRGLNIAFGLESPDSLVRGADGRRLSPNDERWPDLALRIERRRPWGHLSVAALGREIRIEQATADAAAWGGVFSASGLVRVAERDDIRFVLSGGNAIGRYLNAGFVDDARIGGDGELDLVTAAGAYVAYRHWWSRHWRSNLLIGATWLDDDGALPEENAHAYSVHANLLWSPLLTTSLGIEWIHAGRRRVDGRDGAIDRLQFTVIHKF